MAKYQRQVIHLYLKESGEHHYFGSIPAMFENFTPEQIGTSISSLHNRWREGAWENDKVVLRKGRLVTKQ